MKKVLIIGGASTIAVATARMMAPRGDQFFLIDINAERLENVAGDLTARGAQSVETFSADLCDHDTHEGCLKKALESLGKIDIALIAHGVLGDQKACEQSVDAALRLINVNGVSAVALLSRLGNILEEQGHGSLVVMSSVAGERGRASNYVYGAAMAMKTAFLEGLCDRLSPKGIQVLTIKAGFVDTPMTAAFDKKGPLWAQPEDIAAGIMRGLESGKSVMYLPFFWRYIMLVICNIPSFIFRRMNF
jgi:hypothetical protein